MEQSEKLNHLNDVKYKIILKEKNGQFRLSISELGLFGVGKSADEAYKNLIANKIKYFEQMLEIGIEDEITLPQDNLIQINGTSFNLRTKIIQYVVIFMLTVSIFFVVKTSIKTAVESSKNMIKAKILSELQNANIPEIKEKRLIIFKDVLKAYSPFLDELKKNWQCETKSSAVK